jgi:hypothetical protein
MNPQQLCRIGKQPARMVPCCGLCCCLYAQTFTHAVLVGMIVSGTVHSAGRGLVVG